MTHNETRGIMKGKNIPRISPLFAAASVVLALAGQYFLYVKKMPLPGILVFLFAAAFLIAAEIAGKPKKAEKKPEPAKQMLRKKEVIFSR